VDDVITGARLSTRMPVGATLALGALVAGLVAILVHRGTPPADARQMSDGFAALVTGHLGSVYRPGTPMTSPPGFLLLGAPLVGLLGGNEGAPATQVVIGVASACLLAYAAHRVGRRLHPVPFGRSGLLLSAAMLVGAPTLGALYTAYHPEDVVATALVLLALAGAGTGGDLRTGLAIGAAVLTRQWALLAVAPILLAYGPGWRRVCLTGASLCVVVLAPFAVLEPAGLLRALAAPAVSRSMLSFWTYAHLPASLSYSTARLAPLVLCVPTAVALRRRWARSVPQPEQVLAATAVFVGFRIVLDPASCPYYLLPLFAPLAILALCDPDLRRRPWDLVAALGIEAVLLLEPHYIITPTRPAVLMAVASTAAGIGGVVCAWRTASGSPGATCDRHASGLDGRSALVRS
jgi:hypothetical protein